MAPRAGNARLEFDLSNPTEREAYEDASHGAEWKQLVRDVCEEFLLPSTEREDWSAAFSAQEILGYIEEYMDEHGLVP